jgi:ribonuclease HI
MNKKITIHTDASNIKNSNICKISSIIMLEDNTTTYEDFCAGTIAYAELIAVIKTLEFVEKEYQPRNFCVEIYTDHLPNAKLINAILLEKSSNCKEDLSRINVILKRKGLTRQDIRVIPRLQIDNDINVIWLPRRENKEADKLSKRP